MLTLHPVHLCFLYLDYGFRENFFFFYMQSLKESNKPSIISVIVWLVQCIGFRQKIPLIMLKLMDYLLKFFCPWPKPHHWRNLSLYLN